MQIIMKPIKEKKKMMSKKIIRKKRKRNQKNLNLEKNFNFHQLSHLLRYCWDIKVLFRC